MHISKDILNQAVKKHIITEVQAKNLLELIQNSPKQGPIFNLTNVLYYFGGLLAIGAMTLFMNLGWELFGGWGIFYLSVCYGILGLALSHKFDKNGFIIPAGICATFVISLTPLAIYGFQKGMGWWPDNIDYYEYHYIIHWRWIFMELGTLAAGLVLAWIYRYPFMIMPIAVTLWYLSMDLSAMLQKEYISFEHGSLVTMYFGLITALIAFWVDIRSRDTADYAYWLYLFGVMAFWSGLSAQSSDFELSKFIYFSINLVLILLGVILDRKVFVIFGALGSFYYIGHLAFKVFADSYFFPVALTIIGFMIIYIGILWQKHEANITHRIRSVLPNQLRELLQSRNNF